MSGGRAPEPVAQKWRPTLGLVVTVVLATVVALPLVGLFFFRIYENQLIHQTEAELVAQSTVLAAIFAREVDSALPPDLPLGAAVPPDRARAAAEPFSPIPPALDLASGDLLGRRPDARPAAAPHPGWLALGARLSSDLAQIQRVTLAGFRILDPNGTVIAGREELGLSLAHVEEVAAALKGRFRSALRTRVSNNPPPPLYSLSRGTGVRVFTAMPVTVRGQVAGVVYASRTPSNIFKHLYEERGKVMLAGLAIAAVTLAIGFTFLRFITRPVHELIRRTGEIGRGDRGAMRPLAHHGTHEFAMLSQSFLDMAQRLHDRSDYIHTFAAHVSHELKSPLTSIRGAAELLRDSLGAAAHRMTDAERRAFLDNIVADAERLTALLNRLRELARADNPQVRGRSALAPVIAELRSAFPELTIRAVGALEREARISAENLRIALSHLADNAARHGAKTLAIQAEEERGFVRLTVRDDGEGISEQNRERIFDPFFTTRREKGGTGMGLVIVRSLFEAHGGSIALRASSGGAAFEIRLPA